MVKIDNTDDTKVQVFADIWLCKMVSFCVYQPYPTKNGQIKTAYGAVPYVAFPNGLWNTEADKEGRLWMHYSVLIAFISG